MEHFKKGQIVPRRLGIVVADYRRAQHLAIFGQDCTWDGKRLISVEPAKRMILVRVHRPGPRMNNGTRKRYGFKVDLKSFDYTEDGRGVLERNS